MWEGAAWELSPGFPGVEPPRCLGNAGLCYCGAVRVHHADSDPHRYLTHVREHPDAALHGRFLARHQPVAVVNPEDALQQLHEDGLAGLRERERGRGRGHVKACADHSRTDREGLTPMSWGPGLAKGERARSTLRPCRSQVRSDKGCLTARRGLETGILAQVPTSRVASSKLPRLSEPGLCPARN